MPPAIPAAFQKYLATNEYPYVSSEPMQLRLNDQTFITDLQFKNKYTALESRFRQLQPANQLRFEEFAQSNKQTLERARKEALDLRQLVENIKLIKKLISSDNESLRSEAEELKRTIQSSNVSSDVRNFLEEAKTRQESSSRKIMAAFLGANNFVRVSKENDSKRAGLEEENALLRSNNDQLLRKNKDLEDQQLNSHFNTVPKEAIVTPPVRNIVLEQAVELKPAPPAPIQDPLPQPAHKEDEDFFGDEAQPDPIPPQANDQVDDDFFDDEPQPPNILPPDLTAPIEPPKRIEEPLITQPPALAKAEDLIVPPCLTRPPTGP